MKKYWSLILYSILTLVIVTIRVIYSLKTGFILPDEATYLQGGFPSRWLFQSFVGLFNFSSVWMFIAVMPFINSLFAIGSLILIYRITDSNWITIATFLTLTFLMNIPFVLTENMALFFLLAGLFYLTEFIREDTSTMALIIAFGFLTLASFTREVYVIFLLGNGLFVAWLWITKRKRTFEGMVFSILTTIVALARIPMIWNWSAYEILPNVMYPNLESIRVSLLERVYQTAISYGCGITFGIGFLSFIVLEKERNGLLFFNSFLAFIAPIGSNFVLAQYSFHNSISSLGTYIRLSHTALPSYLSIKASEVKKFFIVSIPLCLISIPLINYGIQANLSQEFTDRLSFNYRAPWLRLSETVDNSRVLVFAEPLPRAQLFAGSENVTIIHPPFNESVFQKMLREGWNNIYMYGEIHPLHWKVLEYNVPYYYRIVTEKIIQEDAIWIDEESYLVKWDE